MTNAVAVELNVPVGRILAPGNAARAQEVLDLGPRHANQRTDDSAGNFAKYADGFNSRETRQSRPPKQPEKHCLGLVVARVPECDSIDRMIAHQPAKEFPPRFAKPLF